MAKKVIRFSIMATENVGGRRRQIEEFKKKSDAKKFIKKLNAPGKLRTLPSGKTFRLTSFRGGQSGTGINNPRIKKVKVFR